MHKINVASDWTLEGRQAVGLKQAFYSCHSHIIRAKNFFFLLGLLSAGAAAAESRRIHTV